MEQNRRKEKKKAAILVLLYLYGRGGEIIEDVIKIIKI